jgi:protein-glutamine gamma-glutamyltransferase
VGRTLLLYPLPAILLAGAWLRLEEAAAGGDVVLLVALAGLPALARPLWARLLAAAVTLPLAARVIFGLSPLDARPFDDERSFFGPLAAQFERGFLSFYDVAQPFDPGEHPLMHAVVLTAVFAFCLVLGLAVAARQPVVASIVLVLGSAWPATLVAGADVGRGAVTLAAVLLLLAAGRRLPPRTYRAPAVAGVALVVASLAAATSPAVAKDQFLDWKTWEIYDRPDAPVGVRYVWDAQYDGISFPEKKTTVLTITAPRDARYWRATTLDSFVDGRWIEDLATISRSPRRTTLTSDPLLPPAAAVRRDWVRADVRVDALGDDHLVAASTPVEYAPGNLDTVEYRTGNVAVVPERLRRGHRYSVWSYAPRPTPAQLAQADPPSGGRGAPEAQFLQLAPGARVPPFGRKGRARTVDALLSGGEYRAQLSQYRPLVRKAREVAAGSPNQYAAVVALESWFRYDGGFRYAEQPPSPRRGAPPLVDFVMRSQAGYCQHFAGAMTLMLRSLGVPSRVAVGFTSGSYDADAARWTVTDHDAHAWVEVWFDGIGWVTFDPTPSRGRLSGSYTSASPTFNAEQVSQLFRGAGTSGQGDSLISALENNERRLGAGLQDAPGAATPLRLRPAERGESLLRLLFLLGAAAFVSVGSGKLVQRKSRYLTRDPRLLAAACRRELVDFVTDQGLVVPRSATLADLGDIVRSHLAVDPGPFVRAANASRFAAPQEAAAASRQTRRELRRLLRRIRRRTGLLRRVRGTISLRSLAG